MVYAYFPGEIISIKPFTLQNALTWKVPYGVTQSGVYCHLIIFHFKPLKIGEPHCEGLTTIPTVPRSKRVRLGQRVNSAHPEMGHAWSRHSSLLGFPGAGTLPQPSGRIHSLNPSSQVSSQCLDNQRLVQTHFPKRWGCCVLC